MTGRRRLRLITFWARRISLNHFSAPSQYWARIENRRPSKMWHEEGAGRRIPHFSEIKICGAFPACFACLCAAAAAAAAATTESLLVCNGRNQKIIRLGPLAPFDVPVRVLLFRLVERDRRGVGVDRPVGGGGQGLHQGAAGPDPGEQEARQVQGGEKKKRCKSCAIHNPAGCAVQVGGPIDRAVYRWSGWWSGTGTEASRKRVTEGGRVEE